MRNILDIYKEYKIMPNLAEHQLRVAGVAMQICESLDREVDKNAILAACLIHDMGNIIKFKLDFFPEFIKKEDLPYWEKVQKEFIEKYGVDEHEANLAIARELGMNEKIIHCIDSVGYPNWCMTFGKNSLEEKICAYADTRVAPYGVVSLEERLLDGTKRYEGEDFGEDSIRSMLQNCSRHMEKHIFMKTKLNPEDINDESVAPFVEKLKEFSL